MSHLPVRRPHVLSCLRGIPYTASRQASGAVRGPFVNANTHWQEPKASPQPGRDQLPERPYQPKSPLPRDLRPIPHYVSRSDDAQKHLLDPHVLNSRLLKLCAEGKIEDAVVMLQNAPQDSQNSVVWNHLIQEVMRARKCQLGFQLFIEMKRCGHKPSLHTFGTMLRAYADVRNWSTYSPHLDNVHIIYDNYKQVEAFYMEHKPDSKNLTNIPTNMYLRVLGNAGQYQKMFDVFNDMSEDGPCAVNEVTYTLLFSVLIERTEGSDPNNNTMAHQNASDAKQLWKRFMELVENGKAAVDGPLLTSVIRVLAMGRPSDQLLAFDIVRDYCGLCKPGETSTGSRIKLHPSLLSSCIDLCMISQKPWLAIHFLQQVMDQPVPPGEITPLDRGHMQTMLTAYSQLAARGPAGESEQALEKLKWMRLVSLGNPALHEKMHPNLNVYEKAFRCFWVGKDWVSAKKALELMTGYRAKDFRDQVSGIYEDRTHKMIKPSLDVLLSMSRTALETHQRANMRQCLRILLTFRVGDMLREASDGAKEVALGAEKSWDPKDVHKRKLSTYYKGRLAVAIIEMVNTVAPSATYTNDNDGDGDASTKAGHGVMPRKHMQWANMMDTACLVLEKLGESDWKPSWEESLLGSRAGLAAIEGSLEKPRTRRTSYMSRWSDTLLQQ